MRNKRAKAIRKVAVEIAKAQAASRRLKRFNYMTLYRRMKRQWTLHKSFNHFLKTN